MLRASAGWRATRLHRPPGSGGGISVIALYRVWCVVLYGRRAGRNEEGVRR